MFKLSVTNEANFKPRKLGSSAAAPLLVLIVEDDDADAYLMKRLLGEHPRIAKVIHAKDGVEALDMLSVGLNPDLAFIDLKMPRMNGYALVTEISNKRLRFPMYVLTSLKSPSDVSKRALGPADQVLSKPDNVLQMRNLLNRVIERVEA